MGSKKKNSEVPEALTQPIVDALATATAAADLATATATSDALATVVVDEDAGLGVDDSADAALIPWYNLLQSNSPQVEQNLEGARPGLFQNSVTGLFVRQVVIQPCAIQRLFVLWRDREKGGGIVSRHLHDSPEVFDAIQRNGGSSVSSKESPLMIGEHFLLDTYYLYFHVLDEEAEVIDGLGVIACSKSKIKPVKKLNDTVKWCKNPDNGQRVALFGTRWTMSGFQDQQKGGARKLFHNVEFKPFGGPALSSSLIPKTSPLYTAGKALFESVDKGRRRANFEAEGQDVADGDEGSSSGKPRDF